MAAVADVEVSTIFKVVDAATKPLRAIGAAARGVSGALDSATRRMMQMAGIVGGIGAALSFRSAIQETVQLTEQTRRLMMITQQGPEVTSAWIDAFGDMGIGAASLEKLMGNIVKRQADAARGSKEIVNKLKIMGITADQGPLDALKQIVNQSQQGKINLGAMATTFEMLPAEVSRMVDLLKQSPPIAQAIAERVKSGLDVVNGATLQQAIAFEQAKLKFKDSIGTMKLIVGKELLPALVDLTQIFSQKMQDVIPTVQRIGRFLREHLTQAIALATAFGKVMIANAVVMKSTALLGIGGPMGMGLGGVVGKTARWGVGPAKAAATGAAATAGAAAAAAAAKAGWFARFGTSILGIGKGFAAIAGRLGVIGLIISAVVLSVKLIAQNWQKIVAWANEWMDSLAARWAVIGKVFDPVTSLFSTSGPIGRFFAFTLPFVFEGLAFTVSKIMQAVASIGIFIGKLMESPRAVWKAGIGSTIAGAWAQAGAMQRQELIATKQARFLDQAQEANERLRSALAPAAPGSRPSQPVYDFRGSNFSIKQDFAEGFDPDRIAAAFASDLSKLGERRLQSGFSPLFSVR